jgi:Ser/Thr protein kinase RdoA (MazF antagonist)
MPAAAEPIGNLVHGMGTTLAAPDWPPLSDTEVRALLSRYDQPAFVQKNAEASVVWHSPRPMSAAALVRVGRGSVFVKRHHRAVRSPEQLLVEHAFSRHLIARGQSVPAVLMTLDRATVVEEGDFVYEVHAPLGGIDLYRDAISWSPFQHLDHARAAGRALAAFHDAAQEFPRPAREPGVLISSTAIVGAADPRAALQDLLDSRPGLARAVTHRPLWKDFARSHLPLIEKAEPLLAELEPQWGHGDWHPSNLTWSRSGARAFVSGVFDLGLANRTAAIYDLAVALERTVVDWLDLAGRGRIEANLDAADALLDGYETLRPLDGIGASALAELVPVVHIDYALSEVEYFAEVVHSKANADRAYNDYFVGHARWFEESSGSVLLAHLRRRAGCS